MQINGKTWPFDRVFCAELTVKRNLNGGTLLSALMVYQDTDGTTYGTCKFEHDDGRSLLTLSPDSEKGLSTFLAELEKNFVKLVLGQDPKSDAKAESGEAVKIPVGLGGSK